MTFEDVMMGFEAIGKDFEAIGKDFERMRKDSEERGKELKDVVAGLRETRETVNALTGKWGNFVVGLVLPATKKMFKERGIVLKNIFKGAESDEEDAKMEIDILAVNGEYVVAIEVKSTLGVDDVNDHLTRLSKFKQAFPTYADRQVIGAVAGIIINKGVDRYAYQKGLFVIGQSGDTVKILNDGKFKPRCF
ncbi:MAG: hypothetical protein HQL06_15895 [Nitrospirae bacterium]|nr:hypothetical protein [Nitrospirota bacterium]